MQDTQRIAVRLAIVSALFLGGAVLLARASVQEPVRMRKSFADFPMAIDGWRGAKSEPFAPDILAVLGVDEYINLVYAMPRQLPIGLYIGYYQSQRQGDSIHSPLNCMPGAGWEPVSKGTLTIPVNAASATAPAHAIVVNRYLIQKGADRQMVLYWYQSHGRVVASEYASKGYMILDAIRTNRTDAALVRVITPVPDDAGESIQSAEQRAAEFVRGMFPLLPSYLPS